MIILQTLPAVAIALYTRWLHRWALIAGWVVGMGYGLCLLWLIPNPASGKQHFGGSALALDKLTLFGWHPFAGSPVQIYVGFVALVLNLVVAVLVTLALRAGHVGEGEDATHPADYHADEGSRAVAPGSRRRWRAPPTEPFRTASNDRWTAPRYRSARPVRSLSVFRRA